MIFNTGCNNETHLAMESDMTELEEYIYKLPAIPNFNLFGKF